RRAPDRHGWKNRRHAEGRYARLPRPEQRSSARAVRLCARRRRPRFGAQVRARGGRVRLRPHRQAGARLHPSRNTGGHCRRARHEPGDPGPAAMISARPIAVVFATLAVPLTIACGPKHIAAPTHPGEALIVLLADSDTGSTGRASVRNRSGSAELAAERDAAMVKTNRNPRAGTLSEQDVTRLFGDALSALPPVPRHFTLYFLFESDE